MSIRFPEENVRSMGRTAVGVKGIDLKTDDAVVGMDIMEPNKDILVVTSNGFGKRTSEKEYRSQSRGGKGIKTINTTKKNGFMVSLKVVSNEEDLMIITSSGTLIRMRIQSISTMGRSTQGVKLINTREDDFVASVCRSDQTKTED